MKLLLLTLLTTIVSSQALAILIEFDPCTAYKGDPRAYFECSHRNNSSSEVKYYRTYICTESDPMTIYFLDVKGGPETFQVRRSLVWVTPDYEIYEGQNGLALGSRKANGEMNIFATCEPSK